MITGGSPANREYSVPVELRAALGVLGAGGWRSGPPPDPAPGWTVEREQGGSWALLDRPAASGARRPWAAGDRHGNLHSLARWAPGGAGGAGGTGGTGGLCWAAFRLPGGGWIELEPGTAAHPLWGRSDRLVDPATGRTLARLAAVDYSRIPFLPPLDRPGELPPGAAEALLNWLARMAAEQGAPALRYRGPYPTARLFDGLCRSFSPAGDQPPARARFADRELEIALGGEMIEVPVDWRPDPWSAAMAAPDVTVQLRHGIETVWLAGVPFRALPPGPPGAPLPAGCRVWPEAGAWSVGRAALGAPERCFLRVDGEGVLLEDRRPPPAAPREGHALPADWQRALWAACAVQAAPPLAPEIAALADQTRICWGSLPLTLSAATPSALLVEAALLGQFRRLAANGGPRSLAAMLLSDLVQALLPLVRGRAQSRLAARSEVERTDPAVLIAAGRKAQAEARHTLARLAPGIVEGLAGGRLPETGRASAGGIGG